MESIEGLDTQIKIKVDQESALANYHDCII